MRNHNKCKEAEKYILRQAFRYTNLLPKQVLNRTKEAFSDGVSSQKKSWYETIQESLVAKNFDFTSVSNVTHNPPITNEQKYYRSIFEKHFPRRGEIIPYFWMPKYTESNDCSARALDFYDSLVKK